MLPCFLAAHRQPSLLALSALIAAFSALALLASCQRDCKEAENIHTVWYVDPVSGADHHSGRSEAAAWKTFQPLNATPLGPGDRVIVSPGHHSHSLVPRALGKPLEPAIIEFLPGVHEFGVKQAERRSYFISNSVTAAAKPMPIAILAKDCKHLIFTGGPEGRSRTTILMGGRMTHFVNDHSRGIIYHRLIFDLKRPTVSEFRVVATTENSSDIVIADGSTAELRDGKLVWTGDLGSGQALLQQGIPAEGRLWRKRMAGNDPLEQASRIEQLAADTFRLHFEGRKPLTVGHQYQYRYGDRDVVGAHNVRCKDIQLKEVVFHAFAGMGIISQFSEDLFYQSVTVAPPVDSLRACAAWADGFHYSGCRGTIRIEDCVFSGLQDDPINVHGTHLRIVEAPAENQLLVRFIHKQTYGFAAFQAGDEIAVIHSPTLREHQGNPRRKVTAIERINDHDWLLSLDGEAPRFEEGDVVDNLSWYPDLEIRDCHVEMCPTRGFLITTRGKAVVENNTLKRCGMPGILIENDASGWFESGPVRDLTIRGNTFIGQGIRIHPRVKQGNDPVHENIRILGNTFTEGAGIEAHHVSGLVIRDNRSEGEALTIEFQTANTAGVIEHDGHETILDPKGTGGVLEKE